MFWLLFAMTTLFAAYSAQMTAVLSVFNVVMPFENVQGMYRDTDFKVGSVKNTAFDNLFNVSLCFLENILKCHGVFIQNYHSKMIKLFIFLCALDTK